MSNESRSQSFVNHPVYSLFSDIIIPLAAIIISCFALNYSNRAAQISEQGVKTSKEATDTSKQALQISKQAAQDARDNNELINSYTVNLNKPTFNFRYLYGDSADIITGLDIENEGTSLSTNTIRLYPYLEVLVKNNNSEEDLIQQDDLLYPSKYLFDTILVPVGKDVFDVEYKNNRTGTLATIYQSSLYEKLIRDIEE